MSHLPMSLKAINAPSRTRTLDPLIKSPVGNAQFREKTGISSRRAAHGAAPNAQSDTGLQVVIDGWSRIAPAIRAAILAMVDHATRSE